MTFVVHGYKYAALSKRFVIVMDQKKFSRFKDIEAVLLQCFKPYCHTRSQFMDLPGQVYLDFSG
ncbi:hypothetical protein DESC_580030 [Desulfosarcina cetonica]|nr:hypothetical protein DESC_580030 [Desulfosarcina cetonica]